MSARTKRRFGRSVLALLAAAIIAGGLGYGFAQTQSGGFNLNTPASFPVDI